MGRGRGGAGAAWGGAGGGRHDFGGGGGGTGSSAAGSRGKELGGDGGGEREVITANNWGCAQQYPHVAIADFSSTFPIESHTPAGRGGESKDVFSI